MRHIKGWSRVDWGTWALPLYVTYLGYGRISTDDNWNRVNGHIVSVRVLCFGFFIEWSR